MKSCLSDTGDESEFVVVWHREFEECHDCVTLEVSTVSWLSDTRGQNVMVV